MEMSDYYSENDTVFVAKSYGQYGISNPFDTWF